MDDQGGEPGAEQRKGAKEGNIAQTEPNGAAQQEQAKDLRMPVAHQRGAERERNQKHQCGRENEPHKVGFRATQTLGGFPRRNGRGGKQHSAE